MIKHLKKIVLGLFLGSSLVLTTGCSERVEPNELGILVENFGKNPTQDYSLVSGKVYTIAYGTTLYKLPAYEQRNQFSTPIISKSSDSTQFSVIPRFSYRIDPKKATTVVREHSKIFNEGDDLKEVEKRSLQPVITDIVTEVIRNTTSKDLMEEGGNTAFNKETRKRVEKAFNERGFSLLSFSTTLDYSESVKKSIDARNKANSEIATLDSKIEQAEKEKLLNKIEADSNLIRGHAITDQELKEKLIEKWDGTLPSTYICDDKGNNPLSIVLK